MGHVLTACGKNSSCKAYSVTVMFYVKKVQENAGEEGRVRGHEWERVERGRQGGKEREREGGREGERGRQGERERGERERQGGRE